MGAEGNISFSGPERMKALLLLQEILLCSLPCPSQFPLELPKGLFGAAEGLVYLIQKDLSFSSPVMF